nr:MAG TPA: hypothetical protein [Caudoviricetes sp.]
MEHFLFNSKNLSCLLIANKQLFLIFLYKLPLNMQNYVVLGR